MTHDYEVLRDDELTQVVAGVTLDRFMYEHLGICSCGRQHY